MSFQKFRKVNVTLWIDQDVIASLGSSATILLLIPQLAFHLGLDHHKNPKAHIRRTGTPCSVGIFGEFFHGMCNQGQARSVWLNQQEQKWWWWWWRSDNCGWDLQSWSQHHRDVGSRLGLWIFVVVVFRRVLEVYSIDDGGGYGGYGNARRNVMRNRFFFSWVLRTTISSGILGFGLCWVCFLFCFVLVWSMAAMVDLQESLSWFARPSKVWVAGGRYLGVGDFMKWQVSSNSRER